MINWLMREEKELDIGEEKAFQGENSMCKAREAKKKKAQEVPQGQIACRGA